MIIDIIPRQIKLIKSIYSLTETRELIKNKVLLESELIQRITEEQQRRIYLENLLVELKEERNLSDIYSEVNKAVNVCDSKILELSSSELKKQNGLNFIIVEAIIEGNYEKYYNILNFFETSSKTIKPFYISIEHQNDQKSTLLRLRLFVFTNL